VIRRGRLVADRVDRYPHSAAFARALASLESESVLQTLQGTPLAVLFTVSFPSDTSRFETVLITIMDITDRKRSEQALEDLAGRLIHAQEEERSPAAGFVSMRERLRLVRGTIRVDSTPTRGGDSLEYRPPRKTRKRQIRWDWPPPSRPH
jgi:hypothetical protein